MESADPVERVDLRRALRFALTNGWIVVLLIALGAGGAYTLSRATTKVYSSTAVVRVFDPSKTSANSLSTNAQVDPAREVQIEVLYARSTQVSDAVDRRLGAARVRSIRSTSVTGGTDSDTVAIAVHSSSRSVAQVGAQTYAQVFVEERRQSIAAAYSGQSARLHREITTVSAAIAALDVRIAFAQPPSPVVNVGGAAIQLPESDLLRNLDDQRAVLVTRSTDLSAQASNLDLASASRESDMAVVQAAPAPVNPIIPLPKRDAAVGGAIGLLLGLGLVALRVRLRDQPVTSADLAAILPSLSFVVPTPPRPVWRLRRRAGRPAHFDVGDGRAPVRHAYDTLRAWVLYVRPGSQGCSLFVTSAGRRDGTAAIAANLALSLARSGARVVVVDCDLRSPSLHRHFGVDGGVGLSTLLSSSASASGPAGVRQVQRGGTAIDVLPAGPPLTDPADLLVRPDVALIDDDLKHTYDYVVLAGPAVVPAADALTLAQIADAVLLVVRSGKTRANVLVHAVSRLQAVGAAPAGAVLVGVRRDRHPPLGALSQPVRRSANGAATDAAAAGPGGHRGSAHNGKASNGSVSSDPDTVVIL